VRVQRVPALVAPWAGYLAFTPRPMCDFLHLERIAAVGEAVDTPMPAFRGGAKHLVVSQVADPYLYTVREDQVLAVHLAWLRCAGTAIWWVELPHAGQLLVDGYPVDHFPLDLYRPNAASKNKSRSTAPGDAKLSMCFSLS